MASWEQVHTFSEALTASVGPLERLTPMRFASVVCLDRAGNRQVRKMRWGFARRGASTPSSRPEHIHARAETIDTKPTFREAFAERRGILIVNTFNEGKEITPSKTEQHTITPNDSKPLGIAVIYETWEHEDGNELSTFVMVTTPPNPLVETITDRMPAVLSADKWATWLGETGASLGEIKALLETADGVDWSMAAETEQSKGNKRPAAPPRAQLDLF